MNKWKKKLTAVLTLTVFLLGVIAPPALALDFGVYTAPANTYYKNPETGEIEDGGTRNEELGEGMCRSAVGETALIEVDANGNVYVTMRMLLYSNLSKIKFYVQEKPGGSYNQVKASITAEDSNNDSADFRMKMPSAGANVKTVMYVAPMGRDVVFFWNVSAGSAQSGSGDFAVNINLNAKPKAEEGKAEEPKQEEVKQEEVKQEEVKPETPAVTAPVEQPKAETPAQNETVKEEVKQESVQSEPVKEAVNTEAPEQSEPISEEPKQEQNTESSDPSENTAETNEAVETDVENNTENEAAEETEAIEETETSEETGGIGAGPIVAIAAAAVIAIMMVMKKK